MDYMSMMTQSSNAVDSDLGGSYVNRSVAVKRIGDNRGGRKMGSNQNKPRVMTNMELMAEMPRIIQSVGDSMSIVADVVNDQVRETQSMHHDVMRVHDRLDSISNELHTLTILMSQLVAMSSYMYDTDTLDEDSRVFREDAVRRVLGGD